MQMDSEKIKRLAKTTAMIALLALAAGTGMFLRSRLAKNMKTTGENRDGQEADFYLKTVTFQEFQREKLLWKATAEQVRIFQQKDLAVMDGIRAVFYQEGGGAVNLTGREGRLRLSSMNISVRGDIRAESDDGTRFFTDYLDWDNEKRRVTTGSRILVIRGDIRMEGVGLELDPDRQIMTIKKRVHTVIGKPEPVKGREEA